MPQKPPGPPDLNDGRQQGRDGADLVDAAISRAPSLHTEALISRAAEKGLNYLRRAVNACRDAALQDDPAERIAEVCSWLCKVEPMACLAAAYRVRRNELSELEMQLRGIRGVASYHTDLKRLIRDTAKEQEEQTVEEREHRAARGEATSYLRDLLAAAGAEGHRWRCPVGWEIDAGGLSQVKVSRGKEYATLVAAEPIFITRRARDVETGEVQVELSWRVPGGRRWVKHVVPRTLVADSRGLAKLAGMDAPVHSGNALALVHWLSEWESQNAHNIPSVTSTTRMGWLGKDGELGFMLGQRHIGGREPVMLTGSPQNLQHAEGWSPKGTWQGWTDAVAKDVTIRPVVMLGIYAALAPVLLQVLGAPSFVVSWDGATSGGKTTTARLAASVWGDPSDGGGVMYSWEGTGVGAERTADWLQSLPLILDDTKRALSPSHVADALYRIPGSIGRTRGSKVEGERQRLASWKLCLLSTGEKPITSFRQDGGAAARVLSIRGAPFGDAPPKSIAEASNAAASDQFRDAIQEHHGHLGPRFVEWLCAHRDKWPDLRERWTAYRAEISTHAKSRAEHRLSSYLAVLAVAESIVHAHLGVPEPADRAALWDVAYAGIRASSREADKPMEALRVAWEWACAHPSRFAGRTTREHPQGWAGYWPSDDSAGAKWSYVAFLPDVLDSVLSGAGLTLAEVRGVWALRGWLDLPNPEIREGREVQRTGAPTPLAGQRPRMLRLRREAVEDL